MSFLRLVIVLSFLIPASCSRTVYTNFGPPASDTTVASTGSRSTPQYWRHFFLYGWVPGELVIDAEHYCGGGENIERIETRQSFVQGLIAAFAGYYINVYSPYTGRVVCTHHSRTP